MNDGQSNPSPVIRAATNEWLLATLRFGSLTGLALIGFFLQRLISLNDESIRRMEEFRDSIQAQVSEFKVEVARNTSNTAATIAAIQDRVNAHSRRMDGIDGDVREINKKLYDGRVIRP